MLSFPPGLRLSLRDLTLRREESTLVRSPWVTQFDELLSLAHEDLFLASPYITRSTTSWISDRLSRLATIQTLRITCLTNIRADSVLSGSLELGGLAEFGRRAVHFRLLHMPSLHAKVYVADRRCAIVTSGNLTDGGLKDNCEYGVALRNPTTIAKLRADLEGYARLAADVSIDEATRLANDLSELRRLYRSSERRVLKQAGAVFRKRLQQAQERVWQLRARGKSNQAIFSATIEYLLSKGPLSTLELHPLIQQLHPDICDDSIDRVIEGVNFGKRWKHHVRSAQQYLKRNRRITFDGTRWRLTSEKARGLPDENQGIDRPT